MGINKSGYRGVRLGVFALAAVVIVWVEATTVAVKGGNPAPVPAPTDRAQVLADALATIGLTGGQIVEVSVPATASVTSGTLQVTLPIDGQPRMVDLTPVSVRASTYSLKIQLADGTYVDREPTAERTFRGTLDGQLDAIVAATLGDDGLHALVLMPDGTRYWVEPVPMTVAWAGPGQHVVYRDEDVVLAGDTCMLAADAPVEMPDASKAQASGAGGVAVAGLVYAELAIDADYEYYLRYGSVAAVETQISSIINAMNAQYDRDVQIRHVITTIIVRTAEPDPYNTSDPNTLLNQFRLHWVNNQTAVHRDMAQLFTGKDLSGSTIGIAWLGQVCTNYSYSVVESDAWGCDLFACKTDLSAHELGHNWGADHCPCASPPYTMNAVITSSNRFHPTYDIPEMIAYRDSRSCLDVGDELRRVILSAPKSSLMVGQIVQVTATADFRYEPDQDVTVQTLWSVDRPDLAAISPTGLLTAIAADAESCVRVNASYTYLRQTKMAQKEFTFTDPTVPLQVVSSDPPNNAIDARQPSNPDGSNRSGWSSVILTLNGQPCTMATSRFVITKVGGVLPPPSIASVEQVTGGTVRVILDGPIEPGTWTIIEDSISGAGVRLGFLPGDVNGDGTASPVDILALIDALNGVGPTLPPWATDIDRSGVTAPADILSLIDLLNGAGAFDVWNGAKLPQ